MLHNASVNMYVCMCIMISESNALLALVVVFRFANSVMFYGVSATEAPNPRKVTRYSAGLAPPAPPPSTTITRMALCGDTCIGGGPGQGGHQQKNK